MGLGTTISSYEPSSFGIEIVVQQERSAYKLGDANSGYDSAFKWADEASLRKKDRAGYKPGTQAKAQSCYQECHRRSIFPVQSFLDEILSHIPKINLKYEANK